MNKHHTKKDQIILDWGTGEVHSSAWFEQRRITRPLIHRYLNAGLLRKLGGGTYVKAKDNLDWQAAIFTAQTELNLPIHVGGRSVFDLFGTSQYLNLGKRPTVFVVVREKVRVPIWLKQNDWGVGFQFKTSKLFEEDLGLEVFKKSKFEITVSSRERAVMEVIDILNLSDSFEALEQYFEGLTNIRSELTQKLLETCNSVKVKRVFLYMVTKLDLPVSKKLDMKKIYLGSGKRIVMKNGVLDKTFNITVPKTDPGSEGP